MKKQVENGTSALFARLTKIANDLVESGDQDGRQSTESVFKRIDDEGKLLLKRWNGMHPKDYRPQTGPSVFGRQISYLHNEFNLDEARALGGVALVTHFSMIPIYPPRALKNNIPKGEFSSVKVETISESFNDRFATLVDETVHHIPLTASNETFIGGRDRVMSKVRRFLSYGQPVITTMRAIERLASALSAHFDDSDVPGRAAASKRTDKINADYLAEMGRQGPSSRLSMRREYALLQSASRTSELRFAWARHHSHYQTFTAVEHGDPRRHHIAGGFRGSDRAALPTLAKLADEIRSPEPAASDATPHRDPSAFDSFPADWAERLYGRYLQGANYVVVPVEWLFEDKHLETCENDEVARQLNSESWSVLCMRVAELHAPPGQAAKAGVDAADFKRFWLEARNDEVKLRAASELAIRLLRPLVRRVFHLNAAQRREIVMTGGAQGAAIILTDARSPSRPGKYPMTNTLIIDLGMNDFERGRLVKHLSEFSTQRFLLLATFGTFRFFSDALDVLNQRLVDAANEWDRQELLEYRENTDREQGRPWAKDRERADPKRHETLIRRLEEIVIDLTMLNTLVDGGIISHVEGVHASQKQVLAHFESVGHYKLPGFMSMKDFLGRRYMNSIHVIDLVGRRYEALRARTSELSSLVEVRLQNMQDSTQTRLLDKIDRLTAFGITYYFGQIAAYLLLALLVIHERRHPGTAIDAAHPAEMDEWVTIAKAALYLLALGLAAAVGFNRGFDKLDSWRGKWLARVGALGSVVVLLGIVMVFEKGWDWVSSAAEPVAISFVLVLAFNANRWFSRLKRRRWLRVLISLIIAIAPPMLWFQDQLGLGTLLTMAGIGQ